MAKSKKSVVEDLEIINEAPKAGEPTVEPTGEPKQKKAEPSLADRFNDILTELELIKEQLEDGSHVATSAERLARALYILRPVAEQL